MNSKTRIGLKMKTFIIFLYLWAHYSCWAYFFKYQYNGCWQYTQSGTK